VIACGLSVVAVLMHSNFFGERVRVSERLVVDAGTGKTLDRSSRYRFY
jgi:hypothetical protein